MIVFLIAVRHPKNANSYRRVWRLLNATLTSVCNQNDENFRVIVVCNKILPLEKNVEKIEQHTEFITVDFRPANQLSRFFVRRDKGAKYTIGVIAAEKYHPDYLMVVDADDFIGNDIAEYANARPEKNGWIITKGYVLVGDRLLKRKHKDSICGTAFIFDYGFIRQKIPKNLSLQSSKKNILTTVEMDFLIALAAHRETKIYFEKIEKPFAEFPNRSVIYTVATGENRSDAFGMSVWYRRRAGSEQCGFAKISATEMAYFGLDENHRFESRPMSAKFRRIYTVYRIIVRLRKWLGIKTYDRAL